MPLYEYLCSQCHHQCEQLEKINAEPCQRCPNCNTLTLNRIISMTHFQLKGDGWYATDFKNAKNNQPDSSPSTTNPPNSNHKNSTSNQSTAANNVGASANGDSSKPITTLTSDHKNKSK